MHFYTEKRVLITGHTGFKGSWMTQVLNQLGAEVFGYALPPEPGMLFQQLQLQNHMETCYGDIRDAAKLQAFVQKAQPEIVFHFAAQPIVRLGYQEPEGTMETNIMGTVHLLEALRSCSSVKSVVNITTDKVYENKEWEWGYRETDRLGGLDPYSCSKACSEMVTQCYQASFFDKSKVRISTMRAGNVIGGGDFAQDRIIPDCVRAALAGKPILVRNPFSVRPYQYVLEVLYAYLMVAKKQWEDSAFAGHYNVGPEATACISTGQLATAFCSLWADGLQWINAAQQGPRESNVLRLDSSRIRQHIHWKPLFDIGETLERTVQWYKAYAQQKDMYQVTCDEIEAYIKRREQQITIESEENFAFGASIV